jgi:hypothetical protein
MSRHQTVQLLVRKEAVRPALMIDQTEPNSSFDPRFEGRQHAFGPHRRFGPQPGVSPQTAGLSDLRSLEWHSRRSCFRGWVLHASISLRPFAPQALPCFVATMDALTPARRLFVPHVAAMNTGWFRAGLSAYHVWPSGHSVSKHLSAPAVALAHYPSARRASLSSSGSGLRLISAGSPVGPAESSSRLLRTGRSPPGALHDVSRHRNTFELQAGECVPEEDLHLSDQTGSQTHREAP